MRDDHPYAELGAFADGELDAGATRAVAAHLADCAPCRRRLEEIRALGASVRAAAATTAPAGLRARLLAAVDAEAAEAQARPETNPEARVETIPLPHRATRSTLFGLTGSRLAFGRLAAGVVVACMVAGGAGWRAASTALVDDRRAETLVDAHLRALVQDSPIQIASSDAHVVKPWFSGRLEVAPEAPDLADAGFPLVGGRLDVVAGRRVGALVYKRRLHVVDVFVSPAAEPADRAPRMTRARGYAVLSWARGGVGYDAVSDLDAAELERLPALMSR